MNWRFARSVGLLKFLLRKSWLRSLPSLGRRSSSLRLPTGGWFYFPLWSSSGCDAFVTNADMDWGSEGLLARYLEPNRDFFDIGANVGYYSMYCAPLVRRVVCFEPDPRNHEALAENARHSPNISIKKVALGRSVGEGRLDMQNDSSVSCLSEDSLKKETMLRVTVSTIDAFLTEDKSLDLGAIKLDTEGTELDILCGGRRAIAQCQPLILVELQRNPGEGEKQFLELREFSDTMEYRLFAYVPTHPGFLRAGFFRLMPLDSTIFQRNSTKMIFLVPARLREKFGQEAGRERPHSGPGAST